MFVVALNDHLTKGGITITHIVSSKENSNGTGDDEANQADNKDDSNCHLTSGCYYRNERFDGYYRHLCKHSYSFCGSSDSRNSSFGACTSCVCSVSRCDLVGLCGCFCTLGNSASLSIYGITYRLFDLRLGIVLSVLVYLLPAVRAIYNLFGFGMDSSNSTGQHSLFVQRLDVFYSISYLDAFIHRF